jgi:hypothetical protein
MYSRPLGRIAFALALGAWWGCATAPSPSPKAPADLSIGSLYPLGRGFAWSYDVDSGDGQPVLATAHVVRMEAGVAEVAAGQGVTRYVVGVDGIGRAGQSGYLLKPPIAMDASWSSGHDTIARVVALGERLQTAAGRFEDCVVVEEQNAGSGQRIRTTYCPGVGPARVVSEMQVRGQTLRVTATLRGYALEAEP